MRCCRWRLASESPGVVFQRYRGDDDLRAERADVGRLVAVEIDGGCAYHGALRVAVRGAALRLVICLDICVRHVVSLSGRRFRIGRQIVFELAKHAGQSVRRRACRRGRLLLGILFGGDRIRVQLSETRSHERIFIAHAAIELELAGGLRCVAHDARFPPSFTTLVFGLIDACHSASARSVRRRVASISSSISS